MRKNTSLLLLLLIVISKVVYHIILMRDGFVAVSGDDFLRALIANEWAKEPFFASADFGPASVLWMPLHFWIVGVALQVYPHLWLAPAMVSLVCSLLTLVLLYWIARRLLGGHAGWITALLAAFLPWEVWLSMSGISDTLYQFTILSGIAFLLKWESGERKHSVALFMSAASFLVATMVRPEGWLLSVAFSVYLTWGWIAQGRSGQWKWQPVLAAIIPWLFVGCWLVFNYRLYGDPIHFIRLSRANYLDEAAGLDSVALRIFKDPLMMLMVSPLILPLAAAAILANLQRFLRNPLMRTYLFFVLAGLVLLTLAGVAGTGTRSTPQRYVVLNVLLLIPLAAFWFDVWSRNVRKRVPVIGALIIILCLDLVGGFRYSEAFNDTVVAGKFLRHEWETGTLKAEDRVCTESELLAGAGIPVKSRFELSAGLSTDWCLKVISNHPDQFALTIVDDFNREAEFHQKKVSETFRREAVRWILVRSERGVAQVPTNFTFAGSVAGFSLFSDGKATPDFSGAPEQRISSPMSVPLSPDVTLVGYSMDRSSLPKYVSLFWRVAGKTKADYKTRIQYMRGADRHATLEMKYAQQHGAYPSSRWVAGETVEQRIDFPPPAELDPGEYTLRVSLEDSRAGSADGKVDISTNSIVDVGPVWIVLSKRTALRSFLVEGPRDFRLLAKVLWYL